MDEKEQQKRELEELGYKCEIDKGILIIYLEDYFDEKKRKKFKKMMSDYRYSYSIKPLIDTEESSDGKES